MGIRYRVRRRRYRWTTLPLLTLTGIASWWTYRWLGVQAAPDDRAVLAPTITTDRPEVPEALPPQTDIPEKGSETPLAAFADDGRAVVETSSDATLRAVEADLQARPTTISQPPQASPSPTMPPKERPSPVQQPESSKSAPVAPTSTGHRADSLIATGKQAVIKGDLLAARKYFSDALQQGADPAETATLRTELTRLGQETILSPKIIDGDPFVSRYIVQPGDSLAKIAAANKIPADLIAEINGIRDKNMIRAGQTLKVVKGPFSARVDKSDYTLDLYLDKTFVRHFRVGLGADNSTPTGTWQVETKLLNPTYYPPRGGDIISADDPKNPLGERWIALKGMSGEATGQERYGIHGTNEPNSIGRSVSLGCVRMHNEDVEAVYTYLVEKHSTVTIVE